MPGSNLDFIVTTKVVYTYDILNRPTTVLRVEIREGSPAAGAMHLTIYSILRNESGLVDPKSPKTLYMLNKYTFHILLKKKVHIPHKIY